MTWLAAARWLRRALQAAPRLRRRRRPAAWLPGADGDVLHFAVGSWVVVTDEGEVKTGTIGKDDPLRPDLVPVIFDTGFKWHYKDEVRAARLSDFPAIIHSYMAPLLGQSNGECAVSSKSV